MTVQGQYSNGGTEPLDEGWWASVMREEGRAADDAAEKGTDDGGRVDWGAATRRDQHRADWETARRSYDVDETLEPVVVGFNRGGLLVALDSLRGFVPVSHLVSFPAEAGEDEKKLFLSARLGERLLLKIIELDPARGRIVLSERAAQAGPGRRRLMLQTLAPGDVVEGVVTNLTRFGAFVDLGGVEGLIHVSEVSWGRVDHPSSVLKLNQQVSVYVLSVDREHARVALSLRRLQPDPWATVEDRYAIGQVVEGRITNVVDFGAFARIEDGLEGLIHVSELAEGNFMHPRNVIREGEIVSARILSIDGHQRRLGLSLRRAPQPDGPPLFQGGPVEGTH